MNLIIILVVLGGVMFEVESRWRAGKFKSSDSDDCVEINPNDNEDNVKCLKGFPFTCDRILANRECNTDDLDYEFDKDTKNCYKLHTKPKNWVTALKICHKEGSHLVVVNSDDEARVIERLIAKKSNAEYFMVGFHDAFKSHLYLDITGKLLSESGYTRWAYGQPSTSIIKKIAVGSCGCIDRNVRYYNLFCSSKYPFICERDVKTTQNI